MDVESYHPADGRRDTPFLTTKQAAHYLGLAPNTLEKMRCHGGGPVFRHHGRYVRYHITDLDDWSGAQAHRTTSDRGIAHPRRPSNATPPRQH